jgi:hypothetical protein
MRLIATTVVRESLLGRQKTGYIYDVDWDGKRIIRRLPVPEPMVPNSDTNPRGGLRGGRGVAVTRHGVVVANHDTVYVYDDEWRQLDARSEPLFIGIHEISWDGRHLWMTATAIDAVLKTNLDGPVEVAWDPHALPAAGILGLGPRGHSLNGKIDFRQGGAPRMDWCHINCVQHDPQGLVVNCGLVQRPQTRAARAKRRLLGPLGPMSARPKPGVDRSAVLAGPYRSLVVAVSNGSQPQVLLELSGHSLATHNGQMLDGSRVVVNDSTTNTLRIFDVSDQSEVARVPIPGTWLRGLTQVTQAHVIVGTAPATLALVDLSTRSIEERLQLSANPNEAVHGLTVCPPPEERR